MIITKPKAKIEIVPDVEAIAREMTTTSQVGIIVNRIKRLQLSSICKIGLTNLPHLPKIAKKDFAVGIKILTELEILQLLQAGRGRNIAFHQQMVDMSVALDNRKVIEYFLGMARAYGFTPYIYTYNIEPLLKLLSSIERIPADLVIVTTSLPDAGVQRYLQVSHLKFLIMVDER